MKKNPTKIKNEVKELLITIFCLIAVMFIGFVIFIILVIGGFNTWNIIILRF